MAAILVLGAGPCGLTTAMLLARDGHDVTVLERDPAPPPPPQAAWTDWERAGVAQFRQLHVALPRWREIMAAELPDVLVALRAAGGRKANVLHARPAAQTGGRQAGDERFDVLTARRPVLEAVLADVAQRSAGVDIRRGVRVDGLVATGTGPVPHVVGVRTGAGEIAADLVVDAGGRRSVVGRWIAEVGGQAPVEERADSGFAYYSRHYRGADLPEGLDSWLTHNESVCVVMLPADNNTWSVGLTVASHDRELRALRHVPVWEAAVRRYPAARHWIDAEPITDITVMSGIDDRRRRFVVDGRPVVTGLAAVGDASACTNPSLGRGLSVGTMHACVLRDVLAKEGVADPEALVLGFAAESDARVTPYIDSTLAFDGHRLAEMQAAAAGEPYRPDDQAWAMTCALWAGSRHDPVLARALATVGGVLATPADLLADPELAGRVQQHLGESHLAPGPDRAELLATVRSALT